MHGTTVEDPIESSVASCRGDFRNSKWRPEAVRTAVMSELLDTGTRQQLL